MRTTKLAEIAGVTYRRLDYWRRSGVVVFEDHSGGSGNVTNVTDDEADRFIAVAHGARFILELNDERVDAVSLSLVARLWAHYGDVTHRRLPAFVFVDRIAITMPVPVKEGCLVLPPAPRLEELQAESLLLT